MTITPLRAAQVTAVTLIAVAVSQVLFMALSGALPDFNAHAMWTVEAWLYLTMAVAALLLTVQPGAAQPAAAAITLGALMNVVQNAFGIAMFDPLGEGGPGLAAAYDAIHAGAFWFYFAGKVLFGAACLWLGLALYARSGQARLPGGVLALAGLAALAVNALALGTGMTLTLPAGGTGTLAALLAGLALTPVARGRAEG